jgi:hypothetical protein
MDIKTVQIELPVAFEIEAVDYHYFEEYKYFFKKFGIRTHFTEVGFDGMYHAVFYLHGHSREAQPLIRKLKREYEN